MSQTLSAWINRCTVLVDWYDMSPYSVWRYELYSEYAKCHCRYTVRLPPEDGTLHHSLHCCGTRVKCSRDVALSALEVVGSCSWGCLHTRMIAHFFHPTLNRSNLILWINHMKPLPFQITTPLVWPLWPRSIFNIRFLFDICLFIRDFFIRF